MNKFFLYIFTFSVLFLTVKSSGQHIHFSEDELEFIKEHPVVTIGIDELFTPFVVKNKDGKLDGFEIDHLNLLSASTGIKFELIAGDWADMVSKVEKREIDGLAYSAIIKERERFVNFSTPYILSDQIVYSHEISFHESPRQLTEFRGTKIGVQKSNAINTKIAQTVPEATLVFYNTLEELINALATHEIEHAISGPDINYLALKRTLPNVFTNYIIKEHPVETVYSTRKDWPLLKSILDKAIRQVSFKVRTDLLQKWMISESSVKNIGFTKKEKQFIKNHKNLVFGGAKDEAPFILIKNEKVIGYDVELIDKINEISGLNIKIIAGDWNELVSKAQNKKIDGLVTSIFAEERTPYFNFSDPYLDVFLGIFSRSDTLKTGARSLENLNNKNVGYLKGFSAIEEILTPLPSITQKTYTSRKELTQALIHGEIDHVIAFSSYDFYLKSKAISAIELNHLIDGNSKQLIYSSRKDYPELNSILNKCINHIPLKERVNLFDAWVSSASDPFRKMKVGLTPRELLLLKKKKELSVAYVGSWMPLAVEKDKKLNGMLKDYFAILENNLNIKFKPENCKNFNDLNDRVEQGKVDFGLSAEAGISENILPSSSSILNEPFALITTNDTPYKNNLRYSQSLTVGIQQSNPFIEDIKEYYPNINFVLVENIEQGLVLASSEKLDGFLTLLPIAIYNIKKHKQKDLWVGGITDLKVSFRFITSGKRTDNILLLPAINKGIASISGVEIETIREKWFHFELMEKIDYKKIIIGFLVLLSILFIVLLWNRMLAKQIKMRKESEKQLIQSKKDQEMFVQAIELSDDYIFFSDKTGNFIFVNKSARAKFGIPDDITGLHFRDILSSEDAQVTQAVLNTEVTEKGSARADCYVLHYSTKERTKVDSNMLRVMDPDTKEVKFFMNIGRDITEKTKLHQELRKAKEEAEHSNEAKTDFLANMSHEIRTPLNGIIGMTELMSKLDLSGDGKLYNKTISDSGNILLSLINNLLDISKIEAQKMSLEKHSFNLKSVIDTASELCKVNARKKPIDISYTIEKDLATHFSGDSNKLTQILLNLMGNAVKFTEKGSVTLSVSGTDKKGELVFKIKDTGLGIATEDIEKLFVKFYQTESGKNSRHQGTGLGLVISKNIIELMGGEINVESKLNTGTTFTFNIFLDNPETPTSKELKTPVEKKFKIMVAEDNEINQLVMRKQFEGIGIVPEIVDNGTKVLNKLKKETFDLIFMDLGMPDLDGLETTRAIRKMDIKQPVIIALTASAIKDDKKKCVEAGMDDYLSKPISLAKLESTVSKYSK